MMAPLFSTVAGTWPEAQELIRERAGEDAYTLTELTALHDAELHEIVLDPDSRTVWWAWDNSPLDEQGWTVEQLAPQDAAEQASDQIDLIQERQDDPDFDHYTHRPAGLAHDQKALDEYTEILRLTLPTDPREAAADIKHHRRRVARQDALWQRTYAELVRDLAGTKRGGYTRAAEVLGVTDVQIGRIIKDDDKRRATLADAVKSAADAES